VLDEPPRLSSSFSMNDERADCPVELLDDEVPEVVPVEDVLLEVVPLELVPDVLEVLPVKLLKRF
jgi:hypothetical protein